MFMRRSITVAVGSVVLAAGAGSGFAASAAASDGSAKPVFVQAWKKVYLHKDNSLAVTLNVKCLPGWVSSDVDASVGQGNEFAEGHTSIDVACDGAWHAVRFTLTNMSAPLHVGRVTVSSQFAVYNIDTGDGEGARDGPRPGHILRPQAG
jgi:hypothetical protein